MGCCVPSNSCTSVALTALEDAAMYINKGDPGHGLFRIGGVANSSFS